MPLNIAFYSDALTSGCYGLGRYAGEVLRALRQLDSGLHIRPVSAHVALSRPTVDALRAQCGYQRLPGPRRVTAALWHLTGWPALEQWVPWADVVHCVELDYRVPTRKPLIVTIHDLGPLTHPELFSAAHPWLLRKALRHAFRHARALICVSRATADAVERCLQCSVGDRLTVIPEGVSPDFGQPVATGCLIKTREFIARGAPFFLWTGSLNPRKNLSRVVQAFELVAGEVPHHLVLTGGFGWSANDTLRGIRHSPFAGRIHVPGRVSDDELRGLYQRASAFLFPSLLEGFGLPILEAMASGCPVITSTVSSMPEVAGDAALLVNPWKVSELAEAMQGVASDAALCRRLIEQGRARAATFQWDTCARAIAEVYRRVGQEAPGCRLDCAPSRLTPAAQLVPGPAGDVSPGWSLRLTQAGAAPRFHPLEAAPSDAAPACCARSGPLDKAF